MPDCCGQGRLRSATDPDSEAFSDAPLCRNSKSDGPATCGSVRRLIHIRHIQMNAERFMDCGVGCAAYGGLRNIHHGGEVVDVLSFVVKHRGVNVYLVGIHISSYAVDGYLSP